MWIIQTPLRTTFHDTQRLLLEVYISNVRSVFVFFADFHIHNIQISHFIHSFQINRYHTGIMSL